MKEQVEVILTFVVALHLSEFMWYKYAKEFMKIISSTAKWMKLNFIVLHNIRQILKDKYYMFSLTIRI